MPQLSRAALIDRQDRLATPLSGHKTLWHSRIGQVSNAPETYMLDGHQYVLTATGDTLYSFYLQ